MKNMMRLIFFCALVFLSRPAQSALNWEFAGWEGGGCFPNLVFDSKIKGRVYLTSDVAGLWRSDNSGEEWKFITKGLRHLIVPQVVIAPSDSNVLYAGTKEGISYSLDAGATWQPAENLDGQIVFERPGNYRSIAVDPQNPASICAGTAKGKVFCSTDRGKTWMNLDPAGNFLKSSLPVSVAFFSGTGQYLYVGSADGIGRYDRQASLWQTSPTSPLNVTDVIADGPTLYAAADNRLWVSKDNGAGWIKSAGTHTGNIYRLALALQNDVKVIYAAANSGWNGTVIRSLDFGQSWQTPLNKMVPDVLRNPTWAWANPKGKVASLKVDPFDSKVMFKTDWWGVWRSDDGGETWTEKINGAPNTVGSDIVAHPTGIYVATMDNGLLRSTDNGQTYKGLFPSQGYNSSIAGHAWRVKVLSSQRILVTSSPWDEPTVNQVALSSDGGQTFKLIRAGLPDKRPKVNTMWHEGYPRAVAVDPFNSNRIYLGIDGDDGGGLFVSSNGGLSWARSSGQPGSLRIYNGLAIDPKSSKRMFWGACGTGGGVYRSLDGGKTWTLTLSNMNWVFDIGIDKNSVVYAAGDSGGPALFVSRDRGVTWQLLKKFEGKGAAEAITIDPNNPQRIAVSKVLWGGAMPGQIYFSKDGGVNWDDITADLPPGAGAAAMAFSPDGQYLYVSRYAGGVYRIRLAEES